MGQFDPAVFITHDCITSRTPCFHLPRHVEQTLHLAHATSKKHGSINLVHGCPLARMWDLFSHICYVVSIVPSPLLPCVDVHGRLTIIFVARRLLNALCLVPWHSSLTPLCLLRLRWSVIFLFSGSDRSTFFWNCRTCGGATSVCAIQFMCISTNERVYKGLTSRNCSSS